MEYQYTVITLIKTINNSYKSIDYKKHIQL
jgi:hypothetical protein